MLFVLDGKECEDDALFSLNLLLQASYDKSKQEELLGKLGASFKLIESVLGTLNSRNEVNLSIKEHLLTSAIDMVECLRTDPSKVILLKFYLGNTKDSLMLNQSNKFREFLVGNGNFLPLIDALDGCHNESVHTKVLQLFVNLLTGDPSYINLKQTLQEKFLLIDSSSLASWLEKMLLGYTAQSAVGNPV